MKIKKFQFTLRTILLSVSVIALLTTAAVFVGANAAEAVSSSDVSNSDTTDNIVIAARSIEPLLTNESPDNLGEPVITMTTEKAVGETLNLSITGNNLYVDYGDEVTVAYPGDKIVKGRNIRIYGDSITSITCSENQLSSLDVSSNSRLSYLNCWNNYLSELDISKNTELIFLHCGENHLDTLNVNNNSLLTTLICWKNNISILDISNNPELVHLDCWNNNISYLDISTKHNLQYLSCSFNQISDLDVDENTELTYLSCGNNLFNSIDVSENTKLEYFSCCNSNISEFDISNNAALTEFWCLGNGLSSLDISKNNLLELLYCSNNNLIQLDLTNNVNLTRLICYDNKLSSLNLLNNNKLKALCCYSNQLSSINLPDDVKLTQLLCRSNFLLFSDLNKFDFSEIESFAYTPQKAISILSLIKANGIIDLSSEYIIDGTETIYSWYDTDGTFVTPTKSENGVFTFGDEFIGRTLYCKMTNAKFPELTLTTTKVTVEEDSTTTTSSTTTTESTTTTTTTPGDTASTTPVNDTSSTTGGTTSTTNPGNQTHYHDIPIVDDENIGDFENAQYPDGTIGEVDGSRIDMTTVQLIVGNIEKNKKKSVLDAIAHYNETFNTDTNNIALYDVTLGDKSKAQVKLVNGHILVRLKYPDNLGRKSEDYIFHLYHQKADGTIEEIPVICKPNGIWFYATDFSPYALYWYPASTGSPGTGESSDLIWVMAVLFIASLAAAGVVMNRKRKVLT